MIKNIKKIIFAFVFIILLTTPGIIFSEDTTVIYYGTNNSAAIGPHNVHTASVAVNITHESATLSGSAILTSPIPLYGYFRYSNVDPGNVAPIFCNEVFGDNMKSTKEVFLGTGPSQNDHQDHTKTFSTDIYNLEPNTTYYYCAVASDKNTIEYGAVSSFTTSNDPNVSLGTISTKPATSVGSTFANLNGTYNSAIASSTWFEYRKKKSYQDLINSVIGQATASISNEVSLLSPFNLIQNIQSNLNVNSVNTPNINSLTETTGTMSVTNNIAQISTKPSNPYQWSGKINYQSHPSGGRGMMGYPLKNLTKDTTYEFRAAIQTNITGNNPQVIYGNILSFRTSSSSVTDGDVDHEEVTPTSNDLSLGDKSVPPVDAIVRYHEGIEHVLVRQLMRDYNRELIEMLGYQDTMNLETFAWDTADFIARTFGYVAPGGKEIRVVTPDIAAYQLVMKDGKLTIYEYFDGKIVDIQDITSTLRNKYEYEYYYTKKVSK